MSKKNRNSEIKTLPKWELDNFCRYIAEATEKYMQDPLNKKRFEEWRKEKDKNKKVEQKCN